jgi:hypothetical protein
MVLKGILHTDDKERMKIMRSWKRINLTRRIDEEMRVRKELGISTQ